MTKLTFDVDFNKDPEEILKEIQERAKAEVAKRESKIKYAAFLSKLHEKVNEEIGTEFKSINDLIRALTQFANPKLKEKISSSETGRRVTISMTGELFREIKSKLALPNPNKAAIARETGASVVQVRKVASGGYDQKFSEAKSSTLSTPPSSVSSSLPKADLPSAPLPSPSTETQEPEPTIDEVPEKVVIQPEEKTDLDSLDEPTPLEIPTPSESKDVEPPLAPPATSLDLPPVPHTPELPSPPQPELSAPQAPTFDELPPIAPPSLGEEIAEVEPPLAPPPSPSLDLPPVPQAPELPTPPQPESFVPQAPTFDELPPIAPPSLGEETAEVEPPLAPPPAPSLELPPEPPAVEPPAPESSVTAPSNPQIKKPTLSLKPKGTKPGIGGKPGKPTLSLKTGKKKPSGLKITRPPMKPPSA